MYEGARLGKTREELEEEMEREMMQLSVNFKILAEL